MRWVRERRPASRAGWAVLAFLLAGALLPLAPPAAQAQFPGRAGKLAFVRSATGGGEHIWTMNRDRTDWLLLTSGQPGEYGQLDWSADGRRLAYVRVAGGVSEVWTMNADGTDKTLRSPSGESRYNPSWAPTGNRLAVDDGGGRIYVIQLGGGENLIRDLGDGEEYCDGSITLRQYYSHPAWSPLGGTMAVIVAEELPPSQTCDANPNLKTDLAVMSSSGGEVTRLTDDLRFDTLPDYSPDGETIVFQRRTGTEGLFGIVTIPAGGGAMTTLTVGLGGRPRWSPAGDEILLLRDQDLDGRSELWTMPPDPAEEPVPVLQDDRHNAQADWQPETRPRLTVQKSGFGRVTSEPDAIDCGSTCQFFFEPGTDVTLIATPSSGAGFGHWTGCDSNPQVRRCVVRMDRDRTVTASFVIGTALPQADGLIGMSFQALAGDNFYSKTPVPRQTKAADVERGEKEVFFFEIQNDGNRRETITIEGPRAQPGFLLKYRKGGEDVTAAVVAGTLECRNCPPGGKVRITAEVTVRNNTRVGASMVVLVTAMPKGKPDKRDVVRARVDVVA